MEIKTTHELWKGHYHNYDKAEGDFPCDKKWVAVGDIVNQLKLVEDTNCIKSNIIGLARNGNCSEEMIKEITKRVDILFNEYHQIIKELTA